MFDLTGSNTEGQGPEGPVRRGVRVSTDNGHSRLRDTELGADDVNDALVFVAPREDRDAEFVAVLFEGFELAPRNRVGDGR